MRRCVVHARIGRTDQSRPDRGRDADQATGVLPIALVPEGMRNAADVGYVHLAALIPDLRQLAEQFDDIEIVGDPSVEDLQTVLVESAEIVLGVFLVGDGQVERATLIAEPPPDVSPSLARTVAHATLLQVLMQRVHDLAVEPAKMARQEIADAVGGANVVVKGHQVRGRLSVAGGEPRADRIP
ncbi:hypothetical protein D3C72_1447910 [compost metagenome]